MRLNHNEACEPIITIITAKKGSMEMTARETHIKKKKKSILKRTHLGEPTK